MSSNSSLNTFVHPHLAFTLFFAEDLHCFTSRPSSFIFITFYITNFLLLLPLIIIILYPAVRKWIQNLYTTSASTLSHFECFAYHLVIMEIIGALRGVPYCFGIFTENLNIVFVGGFLTSFIWYGETAFHVLTCLERYLAIVHPIVYLGLRNDRGIRIRNVIIGCVWLFCFLRAGLFVLKEVFLIMDIFLLVLSLLAMSFCSLSVLSVLNRPGPGEQGSERVHQSKQRAFNTILTILGVLVLRFIASLLWTILFGIGEGYDCLILASIVWFNLPTTLVLPLLFLYRAGKIRCCKSNNIISICRITNTKQSMLEKKG